MREAKRSSEIFYLSNLSTLGKPTKIIQLDTLINILYYLRIQIGRYPRTFLVDYFPISHFILFLQIQHIRSSSPLSLVTPRLIMDERSHSTACVSPAHPSRKTLGDIDWLSAQWFDMLDRDRINSIWSVFEAMLLVYISNSVSHSYRPLRLKWSTMSFESYRHTKESYGKVIASNEHYPPCGCKTNLGFFISAIKY